VLLVGTQTQIAARLGGAEEDVAFHFVLGKIGIGAALIKRPAQHAPGAGETAALVANCREGDSVVRGRIPDELVSMAGKASFALRRLQHNQKRVTTLHVAA